VPNVFGPAAFTAANRVTEAHQTFDQTRPPKMMRGETETGPAVSRTMPGRAHLRAGDKLTIGSVRTKAGPAPQTEEQPEPGCA